MLLYPNAKINLGLDVLFKRPDGYHAIETVMVPIPLYDILELFPSEKFEFIQSGIEVQGKEEDNLCIKAYNLLRQQHNLPNIYMHLRKQIPMGAGLGGGSSDAAFVIKGLNELFNLQLTTPQMEAYAAELGSDCPFFIKNKAQIAKGRGEILEEIEIDLSTFYLKIVNPGLHVGTKEAYQGIEFRPQTISIKECIKLPLEQWEGQMKNDFETSIFIVHPVLGEIKKAMYEEGAIYASMSGSGSTMYAIYDHKPSPSFEHTPWLETILSF